MAHFTINGYKLQGPTNSKSQSTKLKSQKHCKHIKSLELALNDLQNRRMKFISTNNQLTCHKKYLKALQISVMKIFFLSMSQPNYNSNIIVSKLKTIPTKISKI